MFLSNMTWLAAIRHSDDGNYIAEVPQTSVNPCPLYQDCLRLYVSQRWIIISPVWIVLSCPKRVLSALFDRSATVTAGNDAKNSQMNSMISSQKFNPDTCDQWSFWRTCSSRSSMFFLAGGVPSFRRWILHRRSLLFLELGLAWRRACFTPQVLKLRKNAEFASIELSFCFGARGTLPPATLMAGRWTGKGELQREPEGIVDQLVHRCPHGFATI